MLVVFPSVTAHGSRRQQSDAAHTVVAQLTADKSFFNEWPVRHDEAAKGALAPLMLSHVGVVQHSFPLSAQKVQVVAVALAGCTEDEQVTAPPVVLFLPHLPQASWREQVCVNMFPPG